MPSTLLLDTHAFVWAVTDPAKLSERAHASIVDATSTVLVSAASWWEMAIKHQLGRWPEAEPLIRQHERIISELGAEQLSITSSDAVRAGGLTWPHADPFDRMLAAQSLMTGAALVTRDAAFAELAGVQSLW